MLRNALMFLFLSGPAFGQGPLLPTPNDLKLDAIKAQYRVVGVINEATDKGASVIVLKNMTNMATLQLISGVNLDGALVENSDLRAVKISMGNRTRFLNYVEAEVERSQKVTDEIKEEVATADLESANLEWDQIQDFKTLLEKQVKISEMGGGLDKSLNRNEGDTKAFDQEVCEVSVVGQTECFRNKPGFLTN